MSERQKEPDYRLEKVFLTRELQEHYLGHKLSPLKNRPISEKAVLEHRRQMREGIWRDTGQTMSISKGGGLLNGQHRMTAMYCEGLEFWVAMAYGVSESAFTAMDTGKGRTGGDVISIGHRELTQTQSTSLSGAVKLWVRHKKGMLRSTNAGLISNEELLGIIKMDLGFLNSVDFVKCQYCTGVGLSRSVGVFLHYGFSKVAPKGTVEAFLGQLYAGDALKKGTQLFRLRRAFIADLQERYKLSTPVKIFMAIKTWNNIRRRGERLCASDKFFSISEETVHIEIK